MEAKIHSKHFNRSYYQIPCFPKHISLAKNVLRYVILKERRLANVTDNLFDAHTDGMPLFLARDIFSSCDLLQSNVQRIHARYSKEGLATKVTLEDFRIGGIYQNKMWFYTIQGLFEVIFHYNDKSVQEDCLKQLVNIWLKHSKDEKLPETLSVKLEEETANILLSQQNLLSTIVSTTNQGSDAIEERHEIATINKSNKGDTNLDHFNYTNKAVAGNSSQVLGKAKKRETTPMGTQTDDAIIMVVPVDNIRVKTSNVYTQTDDVMISVVPVNNNTSDVIEQTDDITNTFVTENSEDITFHNFPDANTSDIDGQYSDRECIEQFETVTKCPYCLYLCRQGANQNIEFSTFLIKLNQFILFEYSETELEFLQMFCKLTSLFLDSYPRLLIPHSFLNAFLDKIHEDETVIAGNCDTNFLNFVCKWTGKELHKFEKEISKKVEIFMQSHIQCIDNLPPPEHIIDDIFPLCMKQLIINWKNPDYFEPSENSDSNDFDDHDNDNNLKIKRLKYENGRPNFHIIQLILEFANNALISGVAHVVYSRIQLANH